MKRIYLDNAATTKVDKRVLKAMMPYFSNKYGNPMSLHSFGREALKGVEEARGKIARFFNCEKEEIYFTSGATESNNWVIKGVVKASKEKNPHIITSSIEHHCILEACREVSAEVTYIKPDKNGIVSSKDIEKAIKKNTILISIMYVNNEIGTVQPIKEISKIKGKALFHTDATQAINYFDCDVKKLGVDLLSMSGHKIYGPKGVGLLYIKKDSKIYSIQQGGSQELDLRAGTHNVSGIVGLGKAIEIIKKDNKDILDLRNYLISRILKEIQGSKLNGSLKHRSPNNANFTFKNIEGESLLFLLDKEGIACSTGSACSSGSLEPSHVLIAIGLSQEESHGSLRITLSKETTKKELDIAIEKIKRSINKLRKISGSVLEEYEQL
ncbi:MAG: cysteine desulfurase NifS [Candidatus Microsyncoccus archaeolyticus]|nr:MAG: cysteine desulfurase NifS [Candidatus Parcubacteria bacterium]